MSDETPAERVSRFREHTNTNSSIRPPPDELWKDVDIEMLLDKFSDENEQTPAVRKANHPRQIMSPTATTTPTATPTPTPAPAPYAQPSTAAARKGSDAAATLATAEGTFGRFSRVFANVFSGVLGKRKAGYPDAEPSITPEQAALDLRKQQAEDAYHLAKELGLLPAPKVFVRPGMTPRARSAGEPLASSLRQVEDEADTTQTHPRAPDHPSRPAPPVPSPAPRARRTSTSRRSSPSASPASRSSSPRPRRNSSPS